MLAAVLVLAGLSAGEIVSAVELVAPRPAAHLPRLGLRVGELYDPEKVREAVRRLFATGDFEDVVVERRHGPSGVVLVLRTTPSPRLRGVSVRGGEKPGDLRRRARLRPLEPLWPERVRKAGTEAQKSLRAEGFLDAAVTAQAEPREDGAFLIFTVVSGPRVRLRFAAVRGFEGPPLLTELMRPAHQATYIRGQAEAAAEKMRERLAGAGYWRARVELQERRVAASPWLDLDYVVSPGARMSLLVRGADVPRGTRNAVSLILRDGGARPDALEAGAERFEEDLRQKGHRDVRVRPLVEATAGGEQVAYDIEPGLLATVARVDVRGAPPGLDALAQTRAGDPLREERLDGEARALRDALRSRGHAEARVEVQVKDGGGALPVVFKVEPGPLTLVEDVQVVVPPGEETATELLLRAGEPYEARALATDQGRILSGYRNAGFLEAAVTPALTWNEDRSSVRIVFTVQPGPRAAVGEVIVSGLVKTREEVVRRALDLGPGQPLSLQKLILGQKRLSALGLFERVSLTPLEGGENAERDVVASVSEAPRTTIAYGVGYSERDLFRGSVEVTRRNLFGLDRTLTAFARVAFRGQRFVLSYREPWFLGKRQDLFNTAFYDYDDRTTFDFTRLGGIVQTTRGLGTNRVAIFRLTYQATDVFNVEVPEEEIERQFRTYTLAGPSASVVVDSRDNPLDARRGHFLSADLLLSSKLLGGAQFTKAFFQAARYARLRRDLSLAVSARLGLAATFGSGAPAELPLPERFFAGGDYTLRGFAIDTVGPQEVGTAGELFPTGGNGLVLGSAELRQDLGRSITLAAFLDLGNVYPLVSDIAFSDLRYSTGLGVRYRTPLGPLRLDWGVKLNPRPGESGYRIHLTIGNAY